MRTAQKVGLGIVFAWFFLGGVGHFVQPAFFINIVPPYVPYPAAAVYVSGVFEILGAIGVLFAASRRLAGLGLFLLTLCVTPANVHMWLHPQDFPLFPEWTLSARLVIQVLLLACIWWSTQRSSLPAAHAPDLRRA